MIKCLSIIIVILGCTSTFSPAGETNASKKRPNILLAISDDQSWPHAGAYGCKFVKTPNFDRIAEKGVLFHNAFAASPQCSPSRASILTGRYPWQNGDAAVHGSSIPADIPLYSKLLEKAGYHVGMTGKGWGPGIGADGPMNPAGKRYGNKTEYVKGFQSFMKARKKGQPFCFWFGSKDPHRAYDIGSGLKAGKTLESIDLPTFLSDHPTVRSDLLDYGAEIDRFDRDLGSMLKILEQAGELDNTLVVVTSDNGMPWPRAKANLYEYGVHMPLAICWGSQIKPKREVKDVVSLIDLAPTFLEAAGLPLPEGMTGRSLMNILKSDKSGILEPSRTGVYFSLERHTPYIRANDLGYPARGLRTDKYLYIRNFKPDRWPAGDTFYDPMSNEAPTRKLYLNGGNRKAMLPYLRLAFAKRPAEELYDIQPDPDCVYNLAANPEITKELSKRLESTLRTQNDPRILGDDHFDKVEYFKTKWRKQRNSSLKKVSGFAKSMDKAGWKHGEIVPPPRSKKGEDSNNNKEKKSQK